ERDAPVLRAGAEALLDEAGLDRREPGATVLLRDRRPEQAHRAHLAPDLGAPGVLRVALEHRGEHLVAPEGLRLLVELELGLGEREVHGHPPVGGVASTPRNRASTVSRTASRSTAS